MLKLTVRLSVIALLFCFFSVNDLMAAGPGSGPPAPCGGPFPPCPIPLDGGLSFLLMAGAAYGGKKIYEWKKGE